MTSKGSRRPHRHAYGTLDAKQEKNPKTKARVRRWAKRTEKAKDCLCSEPEVRYGDGECPVHPHDEDDGLTTHEKALIALDTRAHEAWVRLERQAEYANPYGSDRAVPQHEFDAVADEVFDLRYLVNHLVTVLRRNGIDPFKHSKGVKR